LAADFVNRRRATPPEPPTPLEAALSAGAADAELERLLDRRDEFGDDALTRKLNALTPRPTAAVLSLLTRPRARRALLAARAVRCPPLRPLGLLQRLRDADPAAWRRAQQPEAAMDDAGAEEEAPMRLRKLRMELMKSGEPKNNLEQEALRPWTPKRTSPSWCTRGLPRPPSCRELADLHPQALPELWPAELPGGLAARAGAAGPAAAGPDGTCRIARPPWRRWPSPRSRESCAACPTCQTASGRTRRGSWCGCRSGLVAEAAAGATAARRPGAPADCEQSFVLELVKAGWLTAASQLMRLQQTRLVETCVAHPGGLAASAGRWLKSGEQAGDDASVDSGASNRERLRREAVTVCAERPGRRLFRRRRALEGARSPALLQRWRRRRRLALADAAPELLAAPALAEYADRRWADGPDPPRRLSGFGSPAGGPPRFSPRTKHAARLLSLLLFQLLLTVQAPWGGPTAPDGSGLETCWFIWLLLAAGAGDRQSRLGWRSALPPLPPLISRCCCRCIAPDRLGGGQRRAGPRGAAGAKILLLPERGAVVCACWPPCDPAGLRGCPCSNSCWCFGGLLAMAASLLPGIHLGRRALTCWSLYYAASSPAYSILVGVCLFLLLLLCWLLGARFCVTLAEAGDLAVGRQRRRCCSAGVSRDRLTRPADADIEAAAALNRQDVYGNGCQGGGGGGDVGGSLGPAASRRRHGGGGGGSWGAARKGGPAVPAVPSRCVSGKRHNFQRAWRRRAKGGSISAGACSGSRTQPRVSLQVGEEGALAGMVRQARRVKSSRVSLRSSTSAGFSQSDSGKPATEYLFEPLLLCFFFSRQSRAASRFFFAWRPRQFELAGATAAWQCFIWKAAYTPSFQLHCGLRRQQKGRQAAAATLGVVSEGSSESGGGAAAATDSPACGPAAAHVESAVSVGAASQTDEGEEGDEERNCESSASAAIRSRATGRQCARCDLSCASSWALAAAQSATSASRSPSPAVLTALPHLQPRPGSLAPPGQVRVQASCRGSRRLLRRHLRSNGGGGADDDLLAGCARPAGRWQRGPSPAADAGAAAALPGGRQHNLLLRLAILQIVRRLGDEELAEVAGVVAAVSQELQTFSPWWQAVAFSLLVEKMQELKKSINHSAAKGQSFSGTPAAGWRKRHSSSLTGWHQRAWGSVATVQVARRAAGLLVAQVQLAQLRQGQRQRSSRLDISRRYSEQRGLEAGGLASKRNANNARLLAVAVVEEGQLDLLQCVTTRKFLAW
uniref:ANK_REP_REGION domain-containing protein n=1 Tax=Macrostomum lignano TaxID=282301 RepID=A0A1I8FF55_9PLAT